MTLRQKMLLMLVEIEIILLRDEAAARENLQQAYQAASKVFTILDTVMASAINLGVETTVS